MLDQNNTPPADENVDPISCISQPTVKKSSKSSVHKTAVKKDENERHTVTKTLPEVTESVSFLLEQKLRAIDRRSASQATSYAPETLANTGPLDARQLEDRPDGLHEQENSHTMQIVPFDQTLPANILQEANRVLSTGANDMLLGMTAVTGLTIGWLKVSPCPIAGKFDDETYSFSTGVVNYLLKRKSWTARRLVEKLACEKTYAKQFREHLPTVKINVVNGPQCGRQFWEICSNNDKLVVSQATHSLSLLLLLHALRHFMSFYDSSKEHMGNLFSEKGGRAKFLGGLLGDKNPSPMLVLFVLMCVPKEDFLSEAVLEHTCLTTARAESWYHSMHESGLGAYSKASDNSLEDVKIWYKEITEMYH